MPEIGATLREARMRARIDISELEAETKIRAKYLRALENEEWESLPGPTYIKSFLRTYADALGLDGKLLVQEYKARHEHPSESELQPIAPLGARQPRREPRARGAGRDIGVAVVIVALIGTLIAVGRTGGGSESASTPTTTTARKPRKAVPPPQGSAGPRRASLTLLPTGDVYVCLVAAHGRVVIPGQILHAGERRGPYHSTRFTMTFGTSALSMRVNGRTLAVPASANPLGFVVTPGARRPLPPAQRPRCGA